MMVRKYKEPKVCRKGWNIKHHVVAAVIVCFLPAIGTADVIFDLQEDASIYTWLDNQAAGTVTNEGITATISASEGVLNRTASGFGINGPGSDDTDALNQNQFMDITFNRAVYFNNLAVSSWGSGSAGEVRLGIDGLFSLQGAIGGTGNTPYRFKVGIGETVRIMATAETSATNGFSVDSFNVEAIPEPAVISFMALAGAGAIAAKRLFER